MNKNPDSHTGAKAVKEISTHLMEISTSAPDIRVVELGAAVSARISITAPICCEKPNVF